MPTRRGTIQGMFVVTFFTVVTVVIVVVQKVGLVRFVEFDVGTFAQAMAPLLLVALFIERVLEVFVTAWRGGEADEFAAGVRRAKAANSQPAMDAAELAEMQFTQDTRRIAWAAGAVLGVILAGLGVRGLELFVDPVWFAREITVAHQAWFRGADVVLTGAVLAGGSDGLHKLVSVFTDFLDTTRARIGARSSGAGGDPGG